MAGSVRVTGPAFPFLPVLSPLLAIRMYGVHCPRSLKTLPNAAASVRV
jgi:hypothetical protein